MNYRWAVQLPQAMDSPVTTYSNMDLKDDFTEIVMLFSKPNKVFTWVTTVMDLLIARVSDGILTK
jgi:hypothetical protein